MINIDAIEKGYYEVYVNDVKVSQHTKPLKALSRAHEEKFKDVNANVYIKQPNIEPITEINDSSEQINELLSKITEKDLIIAEKDLIIAEKDSIIAENKITIEDMLQEILRLKELNNNGGNNGNNGNNIAITDLSITPSSLNMVVGNTQKLTKIIIPTNATNKSGVWSSSDNTICTVSTSGLVTSVGEGICNITFTSNDGNITASCTITSNLIELPTDGKAFPSALGAGAFSRADVNYSIYEVTNLNPDGPGSFFSGLGDNRIIVFKVSGIINMGSIGSTKGFNNCIVLGQTAPEGGITVVGRGWRWENCSNVVFRYVRFRTWQCQDILNDPCGVDSIDIISSNNIIFDHCSFAYGGDETLSFRGASHTITVQNCMFSYGKTGMLLGDSNDYTLSYDMSLINNFFTEISHRFPNPNSNGRVDIIGNVVYNWFNRLMRTGGDVQLNEIGNSYVDPILEITSGTTFSGNKLDVATATPLIYTTNNRLTNVLTANGQDNTILWQDWNGGRLPISSDFTDTIFPLLNYDLELPDGDNSNLSITNKERGVNAYLNEFGNRIFQLDDLDLQAYTDFDNREYFNWTTADDWKVLPQRAWLTANTSNYGVIKNEHDPSTHTGVIPNSWIISKGLDPATFNPVANDLNATYTNIEVYSFNIDTESGQPLVKAFPTAYGAGAYATGGRGGKICHVDTLTWNTSVTYDATTDSYSGGFYNMFYELDIPAKIIVFDVAGYIVLPEFVDLDFRFKTNQGNITIAGQTAPGKIVFKTNYFIVRDVNNLIWRYCSFTKNDEDYPLSGWDALEFSTNNINNGGSSSDIIIDHCSFFYGKDEGFSMSSRFDDNDPNLAGGIITNVTIQNTLIAASTKGSILGGYQPDAELTMAYSAYVDCNYRFPNPVAYGNGQVDVYNVFTENYGGRLMRVTGGGNFNVLNNYYQTNRANFGKQQLQYRIDNEASLFSKGTIITGRKDDPSTDDYVFWEIFASSDLPENDPIPESVKSPTQFPLVGVAGTILPTEQVKIQVLPNVGNIHRIDENGNIVSDEFALDTFYRNLGLNYSATTETYRYPTVKFPTVQTTTAYTSTLKDGIPDVWRSVNMPTGALHNDIAPNGYTWIENYLNSVDNFSPISVSGVTISPSIATIEVGATQQLSETVEPINASINTGSWSSSNELIATVSNTGLVTGISEGTATITFTSTDGSFSDTCTITVTSPITTGVELYTRNNAIANDVNEGNTLTGLTAANVSLFVETVDVDSGSFALRVEKNSGTSRLEISSSLIVGRNYVMTFRAKKEVAADLTIGTWVGVSGLTVSGVATETYSNFTVNFTVTDTNVISRFYNFGAVGSSYWMDNFSLKEVINELFVQSNAAATIPYESNSLGTWTNSFNLTIDTVDTNGSDYALYILRNSNGGFSQCDLNLTGFTIGDEIVISFDFKVVNPNQQNVTLNGTDNNTAFFILGEQPTEWTNVSRTVIMTSDTLRVRLTASAGGGLIGDKVSLDNLSIIKI